MIIISIKVIQKEDVIRYEFNMKGEQGEYTSPEANAANKLTESIAYLIATQSEVTDTNCQHLAPQSAKH
ncbi:hypothetical protein ACT7LO_001284 [Providencia rettgeri]